VKSGWCDYPSSSDPERRHDGKTRRKKHSHEEAVEARLDKPQKDGQNIKPISWKVRHSTTMKLFEPAREMPNNAC
jgi:hypothetical protein